MVIAVSEKPASGESTRWVSLSQASLILGVNQSTVRRWADGGLVRAYRTPGGHRRLAEADLVAMTAGAPGRLRSTATARIRRELLDKHGASWRVDVVGDSQSELRALGARLLELVADSVGRRRPHAELEHSVDAIGREYGTLLVRSGMGLPSAIEGYTFFRRSLEETAGYLVERRELDAAEASHARENIALLADRVLAGVAAAYSGAFPAQGVSTIR